MFVSTQQAVILCMLLVNTPVVSGCIPGLFGNNCSYQCHCSANSCDDSGECMPGSKCISDWFGPACQYQDLFTIAVTSTKPPNAVDVLKDKKEETCLNGDAEIIVNLNSTYVISWIRATLKNKGFKRNITMFINGTQGTTYTCNNKYLIDERTMDLFCDVQILTHQLTLKGSDVGHMCSLSISGGRNVALIQTTYQSSVLFYDYKYYNANKAVDGNRNTDFGSGQSCTHTDPQDITPNWNVTFMNSQMVNRYVLFNRKGYERRLRRANILSYNADNLVIFNVTLLDEEKIVYVLTSPPQNISYVKIYAHYKDGDDVILTLCEVEIYGDSICPNNRFGLDCTKSCNCENKTETCHVATGGCTSGCAAGFYGDGCQGYCPLGKWGVDCINECSMHCINYTCGRTQGTCDLGCEDGYTGDTCIKECPELTWGKNCSNKCSPECFNKTCNITNGVCLFGCSDGYTGDNCTGECPQLTWGPGCINNCSGHCVDETCDRRDGTCHNGCVAGYHGKTCNQICSNFTWGPNCKHDCSENCLESTCNRTNGACFNGCKDGYSSDDCTIKLGNNNTPPVAAIVAPIVVAIILIVLIIAAIILWKRRRESKKKISKDHEPKQMTFINQNELTPDEENKKLYNKDGNIKQLTSPPVISMSENTYSNTASAVVKDTAIAVRDLNTFMRLHKSDFFTEQFKSLPDPENVSMEIGLSKENRNKNRYKNICTYDHSRVHLMINTARHEGDYINASYIEGYMDKEKFIASQGPNKVIINDFVRMLWEQKVEKVVMLTNLTEEGQVKCERYWPEDGKVIFGYIKVRLASTQVFADYTIRQLQLIKKDEPIHQMTQFHFTSWPDKGVPLTPWSLVDFQQRVASEPTASPVVVHCSAGVGRTGTFIALCNVIKEAEATGQIDFFKTLIKLRQDRVMMIQTPAQYEFLHRAAQVAIVCMGTTVTSRDIANRIRILEEEDFKVKTKMESEFLNVCYVSEDFTKHIKEVEATDQDGNVYENNVNNKTVSKNRFPDILPEKSYIAILTPDASSSGDYINAVLVPSLKKKDQQILSQLPLATTVTDLWRLVFDYKVSLIVEFEFHLKSTDSTITGYLPSGPGESLTFGTNEVHLVSSKMSALWEESKMLVGAKKKSHLTSSNDLKVTHLKCLSTQMDTKDLLLLVKQIRSSRSPGEERVLYICRDGATYCGLACVLTLLLDRMDNDLRLTVPLIVGTIKSIRPQVIPSLEQYRQLYQVLHRYSETASSYTNFGDYQQMNLTVANNVDKSNNMDNENVYSNA